MNSISVACAIYEVLAETKPRQRHLGYLDLGSAGTCSAAMVPPRRRFYCGAGGQYALYFYTWGGLLQGAPLPCLARLLGG